MLYFENKMKCLNRKIHVSGIKESDRWNPKNEMQFLFKLFSFAFLTFGISKNNPRRRKWLKSFELLFDIFLMYTLSITLRRNINTASSSIYSCCALASVFFIILMRLWFFSKGDQVLTLAQDISQTAFKMKFDSNASYRKWILLCFLLSLICSFCMSFIEVNDVIVQDARGLKSVIASDLNFLSINHRLIQEIVMVCIMFNEIIIFMTYMLTLLLCCTFYLFLQKLFNIYSLQLHNQRLFSDSSSDELNALPRLSVALSWLPVGYYQNTGHKMRDLLREKIEHFNSLKSLAEKVDSCTSVVAMALIALAMTAMFETQSLLILSRHELKNQKIIFVLEIGMAVLSFSVVSSLSICASKVSSSSERSFQAVREFADNFSAKMQFMKPDQLILLLMFVNNCNATEIHMTGWQMFNINKSLILTVVGALVTYGVIIGQLVSNNDDF